MIKSGYFPACAVALVLSGCVFDGSDSTDGGFSGATFGCADFIVLRESANRRNVLEITNYLAGHSADTVYEMNVEDWGGLVRISTYDRPGGMTYHHCNDVAFDSHPELLSARTAVSGRLVIAVRNFTADTTYFGSNPHVWKNYTLDAELSDAVFSDGWRVERVRIDSVHVGWLAG